MGTYDELLAKAIESGNIDDQRELSGFVRFEMKDKRRNQAGVSPREFLANREMSEDPKFLEGLEEIEHMAKSCRQGKLFPDEEILVRDDTGKFVWRIKGL